VFDTIVTLGPYGSWAQLIKNIPIRFLAGWRKRRSWTRISLVSL